jgi:hypothetical protein
MTDFDTEDPAYLHFTPQGNEKIANVWHNYLMQFSFYAL